MTLLVVATFAAKPFAIAFLLTRRFAAMMPVAVLAALIAGIGGVYLSFWLDSAPAPTIVLILTGMVLLALVTQQVRTRRAMQAARP